MRIDGKVGVVTGGTRGIGRAVALALARSGVRVCVCGRTAEDLERTVEEIREAGTETIGVVADVADRNQVMHLFEEATKRLGPPEILIAAAGVWQYRPIPEMDDETWDRMMAIHVKGTLYAIQAAIPGMERAGGGCIVTLSSPAATVGSNFKALHYAAAKGAILAMTKSAAKELAPQRIRVNCVSPAARTEMFDLLLSQVASEEARAAYLSRFPLGVPEADDIAEVFVFLASPAAAHMTGQILNADGGLVM